MINIICFKNVDDHKILLVNLSNKDVFDVVNKEKYTLCYDKDKNMCAINIFEGFDFPIGLIYPTNEVFRMIKEITKIDLSSREINGILVGEVKKCSLINGTHLTYCEVKSTNIMNVVCGAKNVKEGLRVVVCSAGSMIPSGKIIIASKLLGHISNGMLCSKKELNVIDQEINNDGIMELSGKYEIGTIFKQAYVNLK